MRHDDTIAYLAAAAWADGPMTDDERTLLENLLFGLGMERDTARSGLKAWEFKAPEPPALASLEDRGEAIALLRALLVLSYSDGHFGIEELPYLSKILDKFKVATDQLVQLRLQAHYYLDPEAATLELDSSAIKAAWWDVVEVSAREAKAAARAQSDFQIRQELKTATEDTLLVILYRGRSFDLNEAKVEFEERRADLIARHGAMPDSELLQAQIALLSMAKWDRLYADRCAGCGLAAPGRKGDLCPRCNEDYV